MIKKIGVAILMFRDSINDSVYVYQSRNVLPDDIYEAVKSAKSFTYLFPKFKAPDFGAAYIAANKMGKGNISIGKHWDKYGVEKSWINYRYYIHPVKNGQILVKSYQKVKNKWIYTQEKIV